MDNEWKVWLLGNNSKKADTTAMGKNDQFPM
jgi:hypothetical protein